MRYLSFVLVGAAALAAGSIASSQTTPRVTPQQLQAVGSGDPVLAQLNAKIDKLTADLAAANKKIDGLEAAQKTIATKGFETAGKLSALDKAYQGHNHYQMYLQTVKEGGVDKVKIQTTPTTMPTEHCQLKPGAPATGSLSTRYDCNVAFTKP